MKTCRPKLRLTFLNTVRDGRRLELDAPDDPKLTFPLVTVFADDADESLWLEISMGDTLVQIPLEEMQRILDIAREEGVHSETWFERNVYRDDTD